MEEATITLDKDFEDLFVIPPVIFNAISESEIVQRGWVTLQVNKWKGI